MVQATHQAGAATDGAYGEDQVDGHTGEDAALHHGAQFERDDALGPEIEFYAKLIGVLGRCLGDIWWAGESSEGR